MDLHMRIQYLYQAIFMPGKVDGCNLFQAKVPFKSRDHERGNETSTRCVNVYGNVKTLVQQQVINSFDVLVMPSISCASVATVSDYLWNTSRPLITVCSRSQ